ncbi:hypothetical protein EDB97_102284 [Agrobacterium tumefaciens]|nr:hypothetical protein EDB97_102284 [Agrobacterium tumefaciens]
MLSIAATAAARRASQDRISVRSALQRVATSRWERSRSGRSPTAQGTRDAGGTAGLTVRSTSGALLSVGEQADAITAKAAIIAIRQSRILYLQFFVSRAQRIDLGGSGGL